MRESLFSSGALSVLARLSAAACGFFMMAVSARAVPIEDFGALSASISYLNVAIVVGMLGHEQLATRQAALGGPSFAYRKAAFAGIALAGTGAALAAAGFLAVQLDFLLFGWILFCAPLVALTRVEQGLVRGFGMGEVAGVPDGIVRPLIIGLATFAAMLLPRQSREIAMIAAWLLAAAIALLAARAFRRFAEHRRLASAPAPTPAAGAELVFSFSKSMYLSTLLSVATNQIPLITVAALGGRKDIALYAASDRLAQVVAMMPQAIYQAKAGLLASAYQSGGVRELSERYRQITRSGWKFLVPASVLAFVFAEQLLRVFGATFADAAIVLRILCVATLLASVVGPLGTALLMTGHARENTRGMLVGCLVQLVLSAGLIPRFGAIGAALAVLVSTLVWVALLMRQAFLIFGVLPSSR